MPKAVNDQNAKIAHFFADRASLLTLRAVIPADSLVKCYDAQQANCKLEHLQAFLVLDPKVSFLPNNASQRPALNAAENLCDAWSMPVDRLT